MSVWISSFSFIKNFFERLLVDYNLFLELPRGGKSKKPFELLDFFAKKSYNKA